MSGIKLDEKDIKILGLLQENCKTSMKKIARKIGSPITTVHAKIKKMEKLGIIKGYKAILNGKKLDRKTAAYILVSFAYNPPGSEEPLSQREIIKKIAKFPEVQEVHIITGDWDILIKVRVKDTDSVGQFVVDKLRKVKGIEKTLSCIIFGTGKETLDIGF